VCFYVRLCRFLGVVLGVHVMTVGGVRVVSRLFVIAGVMMFCGFAMVPGGVIVMMGGFLVMLRGFLGHSLTSRF
jgi:hypothetical protein